MSQAAIFRSGHDKLVRSAEQEAARQAEHRVKARFQAGSYRTVCSCRAMSKETFASARLAEEAGCPSK